jgi:hypothetical protein
MIEPEIARGAPPMSRDEEIDAIVRSGPIGALTVAAIATVTVIGMWFFFYLLVFLPRGANL